MCKGLEVASKSSAVSDFTFRAAWAINKNTLPMAGLAFVRKIVSNLMVPLLGQPTLRRVARVIFTILS